jgi:hypothetical protein
MSSGSGRTRCTRPWLKGSQSFGATKGLQGSPTDPTSLRFLSRTFVSSMRSSWGILRSERIVSGFGQFNVSQVDLSLTREGLHSIVLRKERLEIAKFQPRAYPATRALRSMNLVDSVRSVLKQKGQNIWSVSPEAWVYDAIEMMADSTLEHC